MFDQFEQASLKSKLNFPNTEMVLKYYYVKIQIIYLLIIFFL